MNDELKLGEKLCFVNLTFKSGCTDSIAIGESTEQVWKVFEQKIDKYGKEFKNKNWIFDGIHGNVYVDMSTVAKIEVSEIDKGQMVLVKSKLNKDLEL